MQKIHLLMLADTPATAICRVTFHAPDDALRVVATDIKAYVRRARAQVEIGDGTRSIVAPARDIRTMFFRGILPNATWELA